MQRISILPITAYKRFMLLDSITDQQRNSTMEMRNLAYLYEIGQHMRDGKNTFERFPSMSMPYSISILHLPSA